MSGNHSPRSDSPTSDDDLPALKLQGCGFAPALDFADGDDDASGSDYDGAAYDLARAVSGDGIPPWINVDASPRRKLANTLDDSSHHGGYWEEASMSTSNHRARGAGLTPIIEGVLYLGSYRDTCDADACVTLSIRAFLCVAVEAATPVPPHARGADADSVLHLPMRDAANECLARHVPAACAFIDAQAAAGRPVALYCQQGRSRSVSLAAAYLVHRGLSENGTTAVESIAARYPRAEPNFAFLQQLAYMRRPTPE